MCGIAGVVSLDIDLERKHVDTVEKMTKVLVHRGPDGFGTYNSNKVIFGNTRLAIIDPTNNSDLPMSSMDQNIWICYNGEISNFKQLKSKYNLEGKYKFKGSSDTEVLIYLYKELGIDFLKELSGMFSFCLFDKLINKTYLVRDFYGIIPLFYGFIGSKLYFASEIKSFLEIPQFNPQLDNEAIYDFFSLAYIPENNTPFSNIKEMGAGELIEVDINNGNYILKKYYDLSYSENFEITFDEAKNKIRDLFIDSVERNLISDASLGMTLSGGIDTSSILGVVDYLGLGDKMNTFSLKMGEKSFDESNYQRLMAKRCNTQHHEIHVSPDDVVENLIEQISYIDEPNGNGACVPSYILAKYASKYVKVLLSGEGGDEIFNAYPTISAYKYRNTYRKLPKPLRGLIRKGIHILPSDYRKLSFDFKAKRFTQGAELDVPDSHMYWRHVFDVKEKYKLLRNIRPKRETQELYRKIFKEQSTYSEINNISYIDIKYFFKDDLMVKNDRTFLANSIEGRFPLMDRFLVEYVTQLPVHYRVKGFNGLRHIQKMAMNDFLPKEILQRQGFGLEMPHSIWFLDKLGSFAEKYLNKEFVSKTEILNWNYIEYIWKIHKSGKADFGRPIWCILNYLIWFDLYVYNGNYKSYWR